MTDELEHALRWLEGKMRTEMGEIISEMKVKLEIWKGDSQAW